MVGTERLVSPYSVGVQCAVRLPATGFRTCTVSMPCYWSGQSEVQYRENVDWYLQDDVEPLTLPCLWIHLFIIASLDSDHNCERMSDLDWSPPILIGKV